MKRFTLSLVTVLVIAVLSACNGGMGTSAELPDAHPTSGDFIAQQDDQAYIKEQMELLEFKEFELEVDYPDNLEFDVDVDEQANGEYKVELDDELNQQHLYGRDAFDVIYPILSAFQISKESTEDDVINQVIQGFELPEDYTKLEVEITFNDGTKIEFERRP